MPKMYKIVTYVVDWEEFGGDMWCDVIENRIGCGGTCAHANCFPVEESEPFEWDDDLKINYRSATIEDFEDYF